MWTNITCFMYTADKINLLKLISYKTIIYFKSLKTLKYISSEIQYK